MTDQPPKWLELGCIEPSQTTMLVHGANSVEFQGPDREANAKLFIEAQHMGELVELSEWVCDQLDSHTKSRGYVSSDASRLRAILAKIKGAQS